MGYQITLLLTILYAGICNAGGKEAMMLTRKCIFRKAEYASGVPVLLRNKDNICRGKTCIEGKIKSWLNRNCTTPNEVCSYNGKQTEPGYVVELSRTRRGSCHATICIHGVVKRYRVFCLPVSMTTILPTLSTTGTLVTTTPIAECVEGSITSGRQGNWCYGTICQGGSIIHWDNFNCGETTAAMTTTPPRTTAGCVEGSTTSGRQGNWCYGTICQGGSILHWDNFNCGETTAAMTTTPPETTAGLSPSQ